VRARGLSAGGRQSPYPEAHETGPAQPRRIPGSAREMTRMHEDELELGEELVRRLLVEQFPEWSGLPLRRVRPDGTVNAIFRHGDALALRLPRRHGPTERVVRGSPSCSKRLSRLTTDFVPILYPSHLVFTAPSRSKMAL